MQPPGAQRQQRARCSAACQAGTPQAAATVLQYCKPYLQELQHHHQLSARLALGQRRRLWHACHPRQPAARPLARRAAATGRLEGCQGLGLLQQAGAAGRPKVSSSAGQQHACWARPQGAAQAGEGPSGGSPATSSVLLQVLYYKERQNKVFTRTGIACSRSGSSSSARSSSSAASSAALRF